MIDPVGKHKTVGAISGVFPSAMERAANDAAAEQTLGAQQAKSVDAAEVALARAAGVCPCCDCVVEPGRPCVTCADLAKYPEEYRLSRGKWQVLRGKRWVKMAMVVS